LPCLSSEFRFLNEAALSLRPIPFEFPPRLL
jgi:hypothetical protein